MSHAEIKIEQVKTGVSNTGEVASKHAWNANHAYQRPRRILFGPQGWPATATGQEEFSKYNRVCWPYVDGDNTGTNPSTTMLADTLLEPYFTDSKIIVYADFIATHLVYGDAPRTFDELRNLRARAEWDMTFTVEQFDDGDANWAAATSLGSHALDKVQVAHWPTNIYSRFPFLQQMAWSKYATAYDYGQSYKEGQLAKSDLALIQRQAFAVSVSGWSSEPVRLKLAVVRDTTNDSASSPTWPNYIVNDAQSAEYLRISLVAISGYEYPQ